MNLKMNEERNKTSRKWDYATLEVALQELGIQGWEAESVFGTMSSFGPKVDMDSESITIFLRRKKNRQNR